MLLSPASIGIALRSDSRHVASSVTFVRRAHTSHALRMPASETVFGVVMFSAADAVASVTSGGVFSDARLGLPASVFGNCARGPICIGIPRHLTIRSSRPHVMASAMCFTLRLHMSATPPRVGLTQALGGSNPYAVHRDRLARCSGHFHAVAVFNCCACSVQQSCNASDSSSGALTLRMRCVHRLRNQRASSLGFPTPDPLLRRLPAESFRGAFVPSRFGFRRARLAFKCAGIPRRLTIRSSRPRVVASATCFCATLARVRRPATGRLNSGVRRHHTLPHRG